MRAPGPPKHDPENKSEKRKGLDGEPPGGAAAAAAAAAAEGRIGREPSPAWQTHHPATRSHNWQSKSRKGGAAGRHHPPNSEKKTQKKK
jgi:hypothetical protein